MSQLALKRNKRRNVMKFFAKSVIVVLLSIFAGFAYGAEYTPLQLSLVNPIQLFPEETSVHGLRINLIYGVNKEVNGLDFGPINRTTGTTKGLQIGAFPYGGVNITENLVGLQLGGAWAGANFASGEVTGVQISGIFGGINTAGDLHGVQIAGVFIGINLAKDTKGLQLATLYNQAEAMQGLQFGLVNVCKRMNGVQIGLVNVIQESKLPFFPIINASF